MRVFKLSLLAAAVAGVATVSVAQADTTVYGSVRISETWTDIDGGDDFWDVRNETSRLGFRGSEDLGNGLAAIYHYEFGVDASDTADVGGEDVGGRLAYVGLNGGFGQLTLGRQWEPYYFAVAGEVDVFNGINSGNGYFSNRLAALRSGNMLVYTTPSFNGLTASAAVTNDGAAGDDGGDVWQVAASYDNGSLFLGAGWRQVGEDAVIDPDSDFFLDDPLLADDLDQFGVQGRYLLGAFGLAGSWQRTDDGDDEVDNYDVVGSFRFGSNTLQLAYFDTDDTVDGWIVGAEHALSKRSRLWIEYGDNDFEDEAEPDVANLSIGMRHDF